MDNTEKFMGCGLLGLIALVLGACVCWGWYSAGVQQRIYSRQGIQMSQWEVFVGAEPAERVMQVKDSP